ncbi:MAG: LPS-assembly protein LptD [Nitrosomonadales bacterium]|nr:LPS-assembly protein LptD [Nitrosomonadales bacterium]
MRFRFNYPFVLLLLGFALRAHADASLAGVPAEINPAASTRQDETTVIEADSLMGKTEDHIEATGGARLRQDGQAIRADSLRLRQDTHEVEAQGAVMLEQDGNTISGPRLRFNMNTGAGTMEQPHFYLKENEARGTADVLNVQDRLHYSLGNATYTTCPAGNQDWQMNMSALEIDRERQIGVARNASVEFKGIPILYSPWMDFPLNSQRKSGLLAPVFGGTVKGGSEVTLPFYWNIAPNFDATLSPRAMAKRGLMFNNEFRYLEPGFDGEMHLDFLPNDAMANRNLGRFALTHKQKIDHNLSGYVNFNRVGDDDYFRDLGDAVNATSQVNLLQEGGVKFDSDKWTAVMRAQRYQTLQDPIAPIVEPYARLPQLTLNSRQSYARANLEFQGEYIDFSHPTLVNARRLMLYPSISYPLVNESAFYVTPKVALHSIYYSLGANNAGNFANASSSLPLFSVDSGVAFEREGKLLNSNYVQTLEPRAFYVYVPYKDQSSLPNFDSAQADFSFTQMFMENRFFGNDRVGDANYLTLAMTSRWLEQENGMEHLKMMIGERVSFSTPQVNLVTPATTTNKSDILLALAGRVTNTVLLDGEFQFDPNESHAQRYNLAAHYRPEAGKALNFGYRFTRNTLRQVDISTQWPLFDRWHSVARWNYSLQDARILEAIGGLEYNQDCWMLRLVAQRFATATQESNTTFFVQLELNDFVQVGMDPLKLLKQSVPGYSKLNDKSTLPSPQDAR